MGKFKDKVVVVTGGTSGIGLATAQRFVVEGGMSLLPVADKASWTQQ